MDKITIETILDKMLKMSANADYQRNKREKDQNDQYWYWCGRDDAFSFIVDYLREELVK